MAQAALWAPGATLDPGCAPTDPNCGVQSNVATGIIGQVPYYAANGNILAATSTFTILSNGKVGIGTTSPFAQLSISNSATTAANTPLFTIASTTGGTSTSTLMTVLANGNVGIGTTNPQYALDIGAGGINVPAIGAYYFGGLSVLRVDTGDICVGQVNTWVGQNNGAAMQATPSANRGCGNIVVGNNNFRLATSSNYATVVGENSLVNNTSGIENTAIGWGTLYSNTTAERNVAVGNESQYNTTTGIHNVSVGAFALGGNTVSGIAMTGNYNSAFGTYSLWSNSIGDYNTAVGNQSLYSNSSGSSNTAVGNQSQYNTTTGINNTSMGNSSLGGDPGNGVAMTGNYNSAFGFLALRSNTTGDNNSATGYYALSLNTTGSLNTANGVQSLKLSNGDRNTATGAISLGSNTTGSYNVANGYNTLSSNVNGTRNIAVGYSAGATLVSGNNNIFLGYLADVAASASTTLSNSVALGNGVIVTASNQVIIGNGSVSQTLLNGNVGIGTTSPFANLSIHANNGSTNTTLFAIGSSTASATTTLFSVANTGNVTINGSSGSTCTIGNGVGGTSCTSDARLKTNVALIIDPLQSIEQIRGVTFNWADPTKDPSQFIGVIAQDVQKVFPQAVSTTADGFLSVDYGALVAPLIEAVKEIGTISGEFRSNLVAWLGNATNGITDFFATTVHTDNLCVKKSNGSDVCITGDQLNTLLNQSGQSASPPPATGGGTITITDVVSSTTPTTSATSTPSTGSGQATTTDSTATTTNDTQATTTSDAATTTDSSNQ